MYAGLYAPNNQNKPFYTEFCKKTEELIRTHEVQEIYIGGDLNIELVQSTKRIPSKSEKEAVKILNKFMEQNRIRIVSNTTNHTWKNKYTQSKIDYILSNNPTQWKKQH